MSKKVKKTFKKAKSSAPKHKKPVKQTDSQQKPSIIQTEQSGTQSIIQEIPLQTEDAVVVEEMHEELPQTQVKDPGSFTKEALENKKTFF